MPIVAQVTILDLQRVLATRAQLGNILTRGEIVQPAASGAPLVISSRMQGRLLARNASKGLRVRVTAWHVQVALQASTQELQALVNAFIVLLANTSHTQVRPAAARARRGTTRQPQVIIGATRAGQALTTPTQVRPLAGVAAVNALRLERPVAAARCLAAAGLRAKGAT